MAKLILHGSLRNVLLIPGGADDPRGNDELVTAICVMHDALIAEPEGCGWSEVYDTLDDAAEYAADHADRG